MLCPVVLCSVEVPCSVIVNCGGRERYAADAEKGALALERTVEWTRHSPTRENSHRAGDCSSFGAGRGRKGTEMREWTLGERRGWDAGRGAAMKTERKCAWPRAPRVTEIGTG